MFVVGVVVITPVVDAGCVRDAVVTVRFALGISVAVPSEPLVSLQ